ncbi:GNAT family N-acetyltransferase, partial [Campylobacter lari]
TSKINNLKPSFVKIITKNSNILEEHEKFLQLNDFKLLKTYKQMILKNDKLAPIKFDFIQKPSLNDLEECYNFLINIFKYEFELFYNKKKFKDYIENILIYKENNRICGILLYDNIISYHSQLEYIAIKNSLNYKNVAYALLNSFFLENQNKNFYKLFVDIENTKAINFYKKSNFIFKEVELRLYRNFL